MQIFSVVFWIRCIDIVVKWCSSFNLQDKSHNTKKFAVDFLGAERNVGKSHGLSYWMSKQYELHTYKSI
jgi:hypothetical protein